MWQHGGGEATWFVWFGLTTMSLVLIGWVIWLVATGMSAMRTAPQVRSPLLLDLPVLPFTSTQVSGLTDHAALNEAADLARCGFLTFDVWLEPHIRSSTIRVDVYLSAEVMGELQSWDHMSKRQ